MDKTIWAACGCLQRRLVDLVGGDWWLGTDEENDVTQGLRLSVLQSRFGGYKLCPFPLVPTRRCSVQLSLLSFSISNSYEEPVLFLVPAGLLIQASRPVLKT
ncbi:hypothetical protein CHARACLAT_033497 [Characodon lateralis]|uniref:Uncharacterized protein n=1 Tax=Characodon lateralis TaxID=208331 RepID=A0ABU7E7K8_9TELE|nr:hypothetical protein [Characodon lateralis]